MTAGAVLAATTLFVLWQVYPSRLFQDTTPALSDLTGHLHVATHVRDELLPRARLTGWSRSWFAGYPVVTFYFPLASLVVAVLGMVLPITVALKLVAVVGPVTLPAAAYAFGRLSGRDPLTAACYGVSTLPLLLEPLLHLSGGSILAAASSGEYAYGISFSLGLVALGYARAGLRSGRFRALTAVLLAATTLFHLLPAAVVAVGMILSVAMPPSRERARWPVPVMLVAGLLTAFWSLPFVAYRSLTGGPDYERAEPVLLWLVPAGMAPLAIVAGAVALAHVLATAAGAAKHDHHRTFLLLMAGLSALAFTLVPSGRVWNARFLPFWFLWISLTAGEGLAWLARAVDGRRQRQAARGQVGVRPMLVRMATPPLLLAVIVGAWASRAGDGILLKEQAQATQHPDGVLRGYEGSPRGRAEVAKLRDTLGKIAAKHGCGRAHWEWTEDRWGRSRPPLMQGLPQITDGCIDVLGGLYTQSSATTPVLDMVNQRLSTAPVELSSARRDVDIAEGAALLRRLGVRYFMAASSGTRAAADRSPLLRPVGDTLLHEAGFWRVYEVVGSGALVEPLSRLPVVVPGIGATRRNWERAVTGWADHGLVDEVVVATSGPRSWPRRDEVEATMPRRAVHEPPTVTDIRVDHHRISFRVSRTGAPVLVKMSYFPNWRADGADGPWRVTPHAMVVVPTSTTVTLRYGRSGVEYLGMLGTLGGMIGAGVLATRPPMEMPAPEPVEERASRPRRPGTTKRKGKRRRR